MSGAASASARRVAVALGVLAIGLVAIDQLGGAALRQLYATSAVNPVLRPALRGDRIVVVGSSTAKRAFDPDALWPGTYNAAEDGQGIFFSAAYLRNLPPGAGIARAVVGIDMSEMAAGYASNNTPHLKRLAPLGMIVSYAVLGGVAPGDLFKAMRANLEASPAVRCFTMHTYDHMPGPRREAMQSAVELLSRHRIAPAVAERFPLEKAADAHRLMESREAIGKIVLVP